MEALLAQLHTLDHHSALYILHSLTPLPQFEERRILDLLQPLPNSPAPGQHLHPLLIYQSRGVQTVEGHIQKNIRKAGPLT